MSNGKKFTISLLIEAIDKVTGPVGALTRKVEEAAARMANSMERANAKAGRGGGGRRGRGGKGMGGFAGFIGGGSGGGIGGLAAMVSPEVAAVGAVVSGAVAGFKYFTKASDDAALSSARFYAVMKASGKYTQAQTEALKKSSDAIQDKTAIEDDAFAPGFAALANTVKSTKAAETLKMTLADLMTAQEGLNTTQEGGLKAASVLSKAFNGNAGALKRMGVHVTKAQEAVLKLGTAQQKAELIAKLMGKKQGGLALADAATPQGREKQIGNQWNSVSESIGRAFDKVRAGIGASISGFMPTLQKWADKFPDFFNKAVEGAKKMFAPGIDAMVGHIKSAFKGIDFGTISKGMQGWTAPLKLLNPLLDLAGKIIGTVGAVFVKMYANSQPALQRIVKAFEPIISALSRLWDKVLGPFIDWLASTAVPWLLNVLAPVFEFLGKWIGKIVDWLADAIVAVAKWASDMWPKISKFFTNLWDNIKRSISNFRSNLMTAWQNLWNPVFKWIEDKWNVISAPFKALIDYFTGGSTGAASSGERGTGGGGGSTKPMPAPLPGDPDFFGGVHFSGAKGAGSVRHVSRVELVLPKDVNARILQNTGVDLALGRMGGLA